MVRVRPRFPSSRRDRSEMGNEQRVGCGGGGGGDGGLRGVFFTLYLFSRGPVFPNSLLGKTSIVTSKRIPSGHLFVSTN